MKQHQTKIYRLLALIYFFFPVSFLPLIIFLFDIPFRQSLSIITQPSYLVVSFFSVFVGYGLIQVRRWSWYLLRPLQFFILILSSAIAYRHSQTHYTSIAFFIEIFLIWLVDRRISKELRVPYFMPQIPWWESDRKFRTQIPARVASEGRKTLDSDIIDLSISGCFLKCKPEFRENEIVEIQCDLFGRPWIGKGVVVWVTFGAVTHPRGIGVKFISMERSSRRVLSAAAMKLARISRLNRRERYWLTTEAYQARLEKLSAPLPRGDD